MKKTYTHWIAEASMLIVLVFGLAVIAQAQESEPPSNETKKTVKVEVEITEDGKTSRSIQELELNKESINGQLDEMVEEIEMILEEAVRDIEETDLQITIRRNVNERMRPPQEQLYRFNYNFDFDGLGQGFESESRPYLGVFLEPINEGEMEELDVDGGVKITSLVSGGAAEAHGLQRGDVITSIGGEEVSNYSETVEVIQSHKIGEKVRVEYIRDGKAQSEDIALGEQSTPSNNNSIFETSSRPFLGVISGAHYDDEGEPMGVKLNTIVDGTGAEAAGLQQGDIVTLFDGEPVRSHAELTREIVAHEAGDEVVIDIIRDGEAQKVNATLGTRNSGRSNDFFEGRNNHHRHHRHHDRARVKRSHKARSMMQFEELASSKAMQKKPFLGVMISNRDKKGVEITEIFEGGTAEAIGLKEGDEILKINGEKISDVGELVQEVGKMEVGEPINVQYERDGKKKRVVGDIGSKADHYQHKLEKITEDGGGKLIRMSMKVEGADIEELSAKSGEELDSENSLEVQSMSYSPNPTEGPVKLKFELPNEGDLTIMVFDGNGRKVYDEEINGFRGLYSGELDLSAEPAGVYFISISQKGKGNVARLIKQ